MPDSCPICGLPAGFHDHRNVTIPAEHLKEKGWHLKKDEVSAEFKENLRQFMSDNDELLRRLSEK